MIEELKERIARRAAGSDAKLIEAVETTVLPAPVEPFKARRPNKIWKRRKPRLARASASRASGRCH